MFEWKLIKFMRKHGDFHVGELMYMDPDEAERMVNGGFAKFASDEEAESLDAKVKSLADAYEKKLIADYLPGLIQKGYAMVEPHLKSGIKIDKRPRIGASPEGETLQPMKVPAKSIVANQLFQKMRQDAIAWNHAHGFTDPVSLGM